MNLILFEPAEIGALLPRTDRRARHLLDVLQRGPGEEFDAGIVNGPRGRARLTSIDERSIGLSFTWGVVPPPPDPLTVVVGLPRPQTARDLLRELTALGVARIDFVATDKGDPNYASSVLWSSGEWRRHVMMGAEQAFDTRLPEVTWGRSLLTAIGAPGKVRLALDNYGSSRPLGGVRYPAETPLVLALGAERGWSAEERSALRAHGFELVHLGPRVLRVETAAIAAVSILKASRGLM